MRSRLLTAVAALVAVSAGVLGAAGPATGRAAAASTAAVTAAPRHLVVHVHLSKTTVRIGHRLRVHYSWSDGNGDLVDTNDIGTMAIRVLRDVPCKRDRAAPHPVSGRGTWVYTARRVFTGAYNHPVKIAVGFNVRTGGCAAVEERTATEIVTVLPASS